MRGAPGVADDDVALQQPFRFALRHIGVFRVETFEEAFVTRCRRREHGRIDDARDDLADPPNLAEQDARAVDARLHGARDRWRREGFGERILEREPRTPTSEM